MKEYTYKIETSADDGAILSLLANNAHHLNAPTLAKQVAGSTQNSYSGLYANRKKTVGLNCPTLGNLAYLESDGNAITDLSISNTPDLSNNSVTSTPSSRFFNIASHSPLNSSDSKMPTANNSASIKPAKAVTELPNTSTTTSRVVAESRPNTILGLAIPANEIGMTTAKPSLLADEQVVTKVTSVLENNLDSIQQKQNAMSGFVGSSAIDAKAVEPYKKNTYHYQTQQPKLVEDSIWHNPIATYSRPSNSAQKVVSLYPAIKSKAKPIDSDIAIATNSTQNVASLYSVTKGSTKPVDLATTAATNSVAFSNTGLQMPSHSAPKTVQLNQADEEAFSSINAISSNDAKEVSLTIPGASTASESLINSNTAKPIVNITVEKFFDSVNNYIDGNSDSDMQAKVDELVDMMNEGWMRVLNSVHQLM